MTTAPAERPPGFLTREQFRLLLACLHPDRTASPERLAAMFNTIKQAEAFLVVEAREPRPTDMPASWEDMAARRDAVKRKRTAARAARDAARAAA